MSTGNILIQQYVEIERASEKMLAAAKRQDWDGVQIQEQVCSCLIERLRSIQSEYVLENSQKKQKTEIMQRILLNDAQIRILCEPWLDVLEKNLLGKTVLH